MSDQRKPLEGWTYDPEPNTGTFGTLAEHWIYDAEGEPFSFTTPQRIGIPAPPEPRTGTLGLSEAEVRALAGRSAPIGNTGLERVVCAAIVDAQQFVAEWDAADNAEPDTLTVTRDLAVEHVRYAANCWTRDAYLPDSPYIAFGDACRAALTEAGLK